jgi:hypothetical protein
MRMVGDFDDSANALWTLYGKEAKSHDEARIQTLTDDMDGVLIFVRLYSVCPIARLGIADAQSQTRLACFPLLSLRF